MVRSLALSGTSAQAWRHSSRLPKEPSVGRPRHNRSNGLTSRTPKRGAAPADCDRLAAALVIGVRVVYLLHVTDRCIVEFAGLAGAEPLETDDLASTLLRFVAEVLLFEPASEAIVIDPFAPLRVSPTTSPTKILFREMSGFSGVPLDELGAADTMASPGKMLSRQASNLGSEIESESGASDWETQRRGLQLPLPPVPPPTRSVSDLQ